MRRWDVFALGRMRHLDLLALYHQVNPGDGRDLTVLGRLSKERLIAAIIERPAP